MITGVMVLGHAKGWAKAGVLERSKFLLVIFLLITINNNLKSEFLYYFGTGICYDSNPFIFDVSNESVIFRNSYGIGYFPDSLDFGLSYSGSYSLFGSIPERNYLSNKIQGDYSIYLNEDDTYSLNLGLIYSNRSNSVDSRYLDYNFLDLNINLFHDSDLESYEFGLTPQIRRYEFLTELNSFENLLYAKYFITFESKFAIGAEIYYGFRIYTEDKSDYIINNNSSGGQGNGKKYGYMKKISSTGNNISSMYSENFTSLIGLNLSVSKNISDNFGISLDLAGNIHPENNGFYYSNGTTDLLNRELFDDFYNFDGFLCGLNLNYLPLDELMITGEIKYFIRNYHYQIKLVEEQNNSEDFRNDNGSEINLVLKFSKMIEDSFFESFDIILKLNSLNNQSNTKIYTFQSSSVCLSVIINF